MSDREPYELNVGRSSATTRDWWIEAGGDYAVLLAERERLLTALQALESADATPV